ncbi:helix-turn-helix transcriptional regulator [Actinoplanes sp. TRM 88003]|uniref:Helix-turn-helix transcriptional regulator n=1 Tax=Paractinoplanes aksuensis TaxID=2939490 RepID=A0ABT1DLZ2_9ACTN|nr:helix-turn-helix transcriptional regulator [Actinoplanes aksuensis]MCO8271829.1 helix-turn-helix transcriptional regulator [Actinoplanes aksuensis]
MPPDRAALGAFLRSRRSNLTPAQAGIAPFPGPRRVPGLRREELAVLAGLSPDYYSRVEQGRQANVSTEVLDALARALRLNEIERSHLHDLAAPVRERKASGPEAQQRPDPGLLRVMAMLDHVPVLLLGVRSEVLASNALLRAVLGHPMPPGSVLARWVLLDPAARERLANWEVIARNTVGAMRRETGRRPHDRKLRAAIDEILAADAQAAEWWADQRVVDHASLVKHIHHPVAGDLTFGIEAVTAPHDPDQVLVVYTVEPDSHTARALPLLASWQLTLATPEVPI